MGPRSAPLMLRSRGAAHRAWCRRRLRKKTAFGCSPSPPMAFGSSLLRSSGGSLRRSPSGGGAIGQPTRRRQAVSKPACPVRGTQHSSSDRLLGTDEIDMPACPGHSGVEELAGEQRRLRRRQDERDAIELAALRAVHRHCMHGLYGIEPHGRIKRWGCHLERRRRVRRRASRR